MCLRFTFINAFICIMASILMMGISPLKADSLEMLLMPGELIEGHKKLEESCNNCHQPLGDTSQKTLCLNCHEKVKDDVVGNTGLHGQQSQVSNDCKTCHTDHKGRDAKVVLLDTSNFDHLKTDFKLKGQHEQVPCSSCHESSEKFREAKHECIDCHEKNDVHKTRLGEDCSDCHDEKSWKEAEFDHDETDFKLKGKHQKVVCLACHVKQTFEDVSTECNACHKINDVHDGAFGNQCDECHNEKKWESIDFDHDESTDYPLTGAHKNTSCRACHEGGDYEKELKTACSDCHIDDDIHTGRNGKKCADCHTTEQWAKQTFDHDKTDFKLSGSHKKVECITCHKENLYEVTLKTDCFSCHEQDDIHKGQQGESCQNCHNPSDWQKKVLFDHDLTSFPLTGLHSTIACADCHLTAQYSETDSECSSCHEDTEHKKRLGNNCELCHTPAGWEFWQFNHDTQTDYQLTGKHEGLECHACHQQKITDEVTISDNCISCHLEDDTHNGRYGRYCQTCHNSESFTDINLRFR